MKDLVAGPFEDPAQHPFVPFIGDYGTHPAFPGYTDLKIRHRIWTTPPEFSRDCLPLRNFEGIVDAVSTNPRVHICVIDNQDRDRLDPMHTEGFGAVTVTNIPRVKSSIMKDVMFGLLTGATYGKIADAKTEDFHHSCHSGSYGMTSAHSPLVCLLKDDDTCLPFDDKIGQISVRELVLLGKKDGSDDYVVIDPETIKEHLIPSWRNLKKDCVCYTCQALPDTV